MSESLKDASKSAVETGAAYFQHRAFIESLLGMQLEQAAWELKQNIDKMDDEAYRMFGGVLAGMINEAQQAAQQGSNAQMYLQGLNEFAHYAYMFYQEKQARPGQAQLASNTQVRDLGGSEPDSAMSSPAGAPSVDTSEIEAMLEEFAQTGQPDPKLIERMGTIMDPAAIERIMKKFEDIGVSEGNSPTLDAKDFYRPRTEKYKLKWPLSTALPQIPVPFDELDPENQFDVLFSEFTQREVEGMQALITGDIASAEAAFKECLERAQQLEVGELKALSFEGFMRIAQKNGDRTAEREWIAQAKKARAETDPPNG